MFVTLEDTYSDQTRLNAFAQRPFRNDHSQVKVAGVKFVVNDAPWLKG